MKKKNFRLGSAALVGLVCCFLALSALLFSSLGMPGGNGFGAGSGKTSQSHGNSTKHGKLNLPPRGRSYPHGMGVPAGDLAKNDTNPCLTAPALCAGVDFYQSTDGQGGSSRRGPGDAIFGSGKDGTAGDRNFPNPAFSGFPYFGGGGGPAAGSSGGAGENGGSSPNSGHDGGKNSKGSGDPADGAAPSFDDPDPGTTSAPNQPGSGSLRISQFVPGDPPSDPPSQGNPDSSTGAPQFSSPDPQPGSDPQDPPITIPEPSTFWLFVGSMGSAFAALRLSRRAKST